MSAFDVLLDYPVIRRVAQVDDCLHDVRQPGTRFLQQGFDIFQHTSRLLQDIPRIYDLAFVVDTRGSGDEDLFPVAISYGCPPFESDPVFVCRIQVGGSIEELDLSGVQAFYGIGIHLDKNVRIGMAPLYSRTGDIMGLFRQVLREENLFAGFDDAGIVDIISGSTTATTGISCASTQTNLRFFSTSVTT